MRWSTLVAVSMLSGCVFHGCLLGAPDWCPENATGSLFDDGDCECPTSAAVESGTADKSFCIAPGKVCSVGLVGASCECSAVTRAWHCSAALDFGVRRDLAVFVDFDLGRPPDAARVPDDAGEIPDGGEVD